MKKAPGFTFLETLVATAVLVIALGGVLELYNRTLEASTFSQKQYKYLMEAQTKMDDLLYKAEENFSKVLNQDGATLPGYSSVAEVPVEVIRAFLANYFSPYRASWGEETYNWYVSYYTNYIIQYGAQIGVIDGNNLVLWDYFIIPFPPPSTSDYRGRVYVTNIHPGTTATTTNLLRAKVVICWKDKGGIIGEDKNLNGALDAGEDDNANGEIDSPCQLETVMARKD